MSCAACRKRCDAVRARVSNSCEARARSVDPHAARPSECGEAQPREPRRCALAAGRARPARRAGALRGCRSLEPGLSAPSFRRSAGEPRARCFGAVRRRQSRAGGSRRDVGPCRPGDERRSAFLERGAVPPAAERAGTTHIRVSRCVYLRIPAKACPPEDRAMRNAREPGSGDCGAVHVLSQGAAPCLPRPYPRTTALAGGHDGLISRSAEPSCLPEGT